MSRRAMVMTVLVGGTAACGGGEPASRAETLFAGVSMAVRDTLLPVAIEASGTAEPIQQTTLATRLMAAVVAVAVREGDRVAAGQVLARLDARDLDAKAAQVEAGLAEAEAVEREAEAMARRIRALYADSAATRVQFEQAETGLARAQAAARTARAAAAEVAAHRGYAEIVAPFGGVVIRRFVDLGAMAAPGAPLFTVEDASRLRVRVTATPDQVRNLVRGTPVTVVVERRSVAGEVEAVVRAPVGNLTQVNVLVANPAGALASGSAATVLLPQGERRGLVVPETVVIREGDLTGVDVVVAGGVERRWVRVGRALPDGSVEILSGLGAGDRIVTRGAAPGGD